MSVDLAQLEKESDKRVQRLLEKSRKKEIAEFDAASDVEKLPYDEPDFIFKQQDKRIIWMKKGERYCAARYYPNEECAAETMELLKGLRQ